MRAASGEWREASGSGRRRRWPLMTSCWPNTAGRLVRAMRACWSPLWCGLVSASHGNPDGAQLAACYAFGIARNHPFMDGNKRTGFVAAELFRAINGLVLPASGAHCVTATLRLAAGELDEDAFAARFRSHIVRR